MVYQPPVAVFIENRFGQKKALGIPEK